MDVRINIARLLEEHDCVILPGFGGFIGNYAPARIDPVSHTFVPPSKKILFNINLKQNDGLLCNRLVTGEGISYADALLLVNEMINSIRHDLGSGKAFVIPEVGKLFSGREGNLQFEQEKDSNLLPDAFGLQTFVSPPVTRNSYSDRFEKAITRPNERQLAKRQFPVSLKWAAMLAIPIGTAAIIGITQYDKLRNPSVNNAGILSSVFSKFSASSLVDKKEAPAHGPDVTYDNGAIPSVFSEPVASDSPSANSAVNSGTDQQLSQGSNSSGMIPEDNSVTESPVKKNPLIVPDSDEKATGQYSDSPVDEGISPVSNNDNFAIIIGAFKVKENAEKCVREANSRGLNAGIYDRSKTGLYRVALTTTNLQKEADGLLREAREKGFSGAWLLSK